MSAEDYTAAHLLCSGREVGIAYREAEFGELRYVGSVGEDLCACGHNVVCGYIVSDLKHYRGGKVCLWRLTLWYGLDIRSALDGDFCRLVFACGHIYKVVGNLEVFG